jgi:hypothetical protein
VRTAFAALIFGIAIGAFIAGLRFLDYFGAQGVLLGTLPLLSFAIVGSFLIIRRAGGPIGWLLGAAGAVLQVVLLAVAYGSASIEQTTAMPGGEFALWFASVGQFAAFGLVISAIVRFPDGRPPGPRFAILLWASVAFVVAAGLVVGVAPQPIPAPTTFTGPHAGDPSRSIENPFALHGPVGELMLLAALVLKLTTPLALIAPLALAVRFRRSSGIERQQLKWLTYTGVIAFGLALIAYVSPQGPIRVVADPVSIFGIGLLPIAIGIAITRYRLYDIDVLIRRTLIYAGVSAVLLATYVIGVGVLQTILAPLTAGSGFAVAISTLGVVALFQPLRTRIQSAVDRRFYRAKYDAERILDAFAGRLRDDVELDSVRAELLSAVGATLQPSHASVWLRKVAP